MSGEAPKREIYFEFTAIGAFVKATAIDSVTGLEVSVMGPRAAQKELQRVALQKLRAQLAQQPG